MRPSIEILFIVGILRIAYQASNQLAIWGSIFRLTIYPHIRRHLTVTSILFASTTARESGHGVPKSGHEC